MSKFKVGETVYVEDGAYENYPEDSQYNIPRIGMTVNKCGDGYVVLNLPQGGITPALNPDRFSTVPEVESPIRTVTRKEIAPGTYGIVCITDEKALCVETFEYTADQLREAAHILNQIAEALEHD